MPDQPYLNSLWIGRELHPVHQLCMRSALHHGHRVRLFSYEPVAGVPEGVELADAHHVLPREAFFLHRRTGSPAPFADRFRIKLIALGLGTWIDTDLLFIRPLRSASRNVFGWENERLVGNAILGMDPTEEAFKALAQMSEDDHLVPPWWQGHRRAGLRALKWLGLARHVSTLPYGTTGPDLLTWVVNSFGLRPQVQPLQVFYSLPYGQKEQVFKAQSTWHSLASLPQDVVAIHLWFQGLLGGISRRAKAQNAVPLAEPGSLVHEVGLQLGMDLS